MEVQGKIIQVLPLQQGTSKAGNAWKKQEYVLETHDQYPRKVKFDFFGDRADQFPLNIGDEVTISFDIESREFNGRWYTDIRGWKATKNDGAAPAGGPEVVSGLSDGIPPFDPMASSAGADNDDLPF